MWTLRRQYLDRQLAAIRARLAMLQGKRFTFDEESQALYDAVAPTHTEAEFAGRPETARPPSCRAKAR